MYRTRRANKKKVSVEKRVGNAESGVDEDKRRGDRNTASRARGGSSGWNPP